MPLQHEIALGTEENKLASGAVFYLPSPTLDLSSTIEVGDEDQTMFSNLCLWIKNYNDYILNQWDENVRKKESADLAETVNEFIDIDTEEVIS